MWSSKVLLKYSLLQLPGLALLILILLLLRHWIDIPAWAEWTIISLGIIIDVIMYPFVWHAYDKDNPDSMSGSQGIAVDRLSPSGYVRINGELWRAKIIEGDSAIEKGEAVTVKSINGLTLIVHSANKDKT
jgi:membrane-bound ClpP family serine protease